MLLACGDEGALGLLAAGVGMILLSSLLLRLFAGASRTRRMTATFARMDDLDSRMAADEAYDDPMEILRGEPERAMPEAVRRLCDQENPSRRRYLSLLRSVKIGSARDVLAGIARDVTDPLAPEVWALLTGRVTSEWAKAIAAGDAEFLACAGLVSGAWTGWYRYSTSIDHAMTLTLRFENGCVTGEGSDDIAPFTFEGTYSESSVTMRKRYATHAVIYAGSIEAGAIVGDWTIFPMSGEFRLWRVGS